MTKRKTTLPRAPRGSSVAGTPAAYAAFWCVHLRTAQRWVAAPGVGANPPRAALDAPAAMVAWVRSLPSASQAKLTPAFRTRIDRFRLDLERGEPPAGPTGAAPSASAPPPLGGDPRGGGAAAHSLPSSGASSAAPDAALDDPDYTEFLAAHAADPAAHGSASHIAALKLQRDFAVYKLQRARARRDAPAAREAIEDIRHLSSVIYDEEALAQKLGRETGDILPWPEVERILRAVPYWLQRGVDQLLAQLCPRIASATAAPLYPEEVRRLIEPALLDVLLVAPFARAAQLNAGTALPERAVTAIREGLAATIEDGAAHFATLYAQPVARPDDHRAEALAKAGVPIPINGVTSGPTADGPAASAAPSDHGSEPPAPGAAISSATPDLGSGANQTASDEQNQQPRP